MDELMQMAQAYMQQRDPNSAAQLLQAVMQIGDPNIMVMAADTIANGILGSQQGGAPAGMPQGGGDPAAMGGAPQGAPMGQQGIKMFEQGGKIASPQSALDKFLQSRNPN